MKATTVKLEGALLRGLDERRPAAMSMAAFVRSVLQKNLDELKVREAAVAYRAFLDGNAAEKSWLDEWDRADLNSPPRKA